MAASLILETTFLILFLSRFLSRRLAPLPAGATQVAEETNRRYRDKLRRPIDARAVSVTLRRLLRADRLRLVRQGRSFHEALYARLT